MPNEGVPQGEDDYGVGGFCSANLPISEADRPGVDPVRGLSLSLLIGLRFLSVQNENEGKIAVPG